MIRHHIRSARMLQKVWSDVAIPCGCFHQNFGKVRPGSHYDVLGVPLNASEKDIRTAFIDLSKKFHPDTNTNDKTLHEKFSKINEAYNVLSNASQREIYDEGLNVGFSGHGNTTSTQHPGEKSASSQKTKAGPTYYEHPAYYDDPDLKRKATQFWQARMGFTPPVQQEDEVFSMFGGREAQRVALVTILVSLVFFLFGYQFLKSQYGIQDRTPRPMNLPLMLKIGQKRRTVQEPVVQENQD